MKKGAKIVILEFSQPKNKFIGWSYNIYFKKILPTIGNLISKDKRAYTYLPDSVGSFYYGKDFLKQLNKAGFKNTKGRTVTCGIASIYSGEK